MKSIRRIIREEIVSKGNVYFYDKEYPGYMYVKEILPYYKMYWIGYRDSEIYEVNMVKDNDMNVYWLQTPTGEEFAYELLPHTEIYTNLMEPHWSLQPIDEYEIDKYSQENLIFPTHTV